MKAVLLNFKFYLGGCDNFHNRLPFFKKEIYKMDKIRVGVIVRFLKNGRCRAKIGHHNYRVFGTEGYMERIDRFEKPVIRYNPFLCF